MDVSGLVASGQACVADGRWDDAKAAFEAAVAVGGSPEALDGLAQVRYWEGDYASAVTLHERAYAGFRARGETRYPAVLAAYTLAFEHAAVYGNAAVAKGWLERGRRLAKVSGDCPEQGWVELAGVLATGDLAQKERHIEAAMDIAKRFGDSDLEFDALAYAGVTSIELGHFEEGMRRLDEAAAATRGGEVRSHTTAAEIYCKMLLACEMTLDVRRAEQWQDVTNHLAREGNVVWVAAICRMYYGGILTSAGRWAEANQELEASVRIYDTTYRALRSGAVVRLAALRVLQGRLEDADLLLAGHEDDSHAVRPLARLHLARGDPELAISLLTRYLAPDVDGALTAPLLALLAEAELAAGHVEEARAVESRMRALAERSPLPISGAFADFVAGLVNEQASQQVRHFESALATFRASGLQYEEARTRLELARHLTTTNRDVAIAEAKTALTVFERLGAVPNADATAALLRTLGVRGRTGPKEVGVLSQREKEVLHLLGIGLSNPEIAARLFISRKTAAHHVSNVLAKLGLRNRAEAAAHARLTPR